MSLLLALAAAMAAGLIFNRFAKIFHLPNVTGYLIAGLLIGQCFLNIFPTTAVEESKVLLSVALGFIAFSIGGEFKFDKLKTIGKHVLTITFVQALSTAACVIAVLLLLGFDVPLCLTLGAIATATAPAATLMVVRQYEAKGSITDLLLPVVALDDAIGLIIFSVNTSVAQALNAESGISALDMLISPCREIMLSLIAGAAFGLALSFAMKFFHSRANKVCLIVCAVFFGTAVSDMFGLSSLLVCMCVGAVMVNCIPDYERVLEINDKWTPPLFLLFFVISGAELDLRILPSVGVLGFAYILARSFGKYIGAYTGALMVGAEKNVRNYLGITLLPQAGVAIGMATMVGEMLPEYAVIIRTVVLSATLIYELIGPLLTKTVLMRAGEIEPHYSHRTHKIKHV